LKPLIPLKTLKQKSKTKKVSHRTNKDSFLLENNWKMEELFLITTSKKNPPCTWFWDWEEECKFSSKLWLEKPLLWTLKPLIPLKTLKQKSKTKKVSHRTNKDSFLLENNWKMEEPFLITTSKKSLLFT